MKFGKKLGKSWAKIFIATGFAQKRKNKKRDRNNK
tara:strand:+ start:628 stop:732 length:105 start_codon:yes stop_codon:yes gene_type:complete